MTASARSVAGLAALLAAGFLSPRVIPYNMDEFVHYHALGCAAFPLSRTLNAYREGCGQYALRPPFSSTFLPLRSYLYIGSLPVVPFYPFWAALRDPVAARVQGMVFLAAASVLATRLLGVSLPAVALASAVLPLYPFAFLVDTGPVGISVVLLLGCLLAVRASLHSARPAAAVSWAALAGFLAFLGLWVKLVFAWWLPAIAAFALARGRLRTAPILAAVGTFALPAAWLLCAHTLDGNRYYDMASLGRISADPEAAAVVGSRLGTFVLHGAAMIPTTLAWPFIPLDVAPAVLAAAVIARGLADRATRGETALWSLCALGVFAIALSSGRADAVHHVVYAIVFAVLAMAAALARSPRLWGIAAATVVAVYWCSLAARLPWTRPTPGTSFGKDRLLAFVRESGLDQRTVQLHASWGTYYIAHLFGHHDQVVLFSKRFPDSEEMLHAVRAFATSRGRRLLLVSRRPAKMHTEAEMHVLGPPKAVYRFDDWWAAEYAP
ncbi:MAG TPA: hypothetical protein VGQ78_08285 [Vicinamibacteria bacterium]|nr:hypothetical protein [Vicinamibacteria bacterium]